jgi:transcriptional regulator with XRE-family HTH domain
MNERATRNGAAGRLGQHIASKILSLRVSNDLSQHDLARLAGIPQAAISKAERAVFVPSLRTLERLAKHFEVPITFFLNGYKP